MKFFSTAPRLLVLAVLLVFCASVAFGHNSSAAAPQGYANVLVTTPSQETVRISAPLSSNITVISVASANNSQYNLGLNLVAGYRQLQFQPENASIYTILVNVSAINSNFAYITKENGLYNSPVRNVTGAGNILINLTVTSTPSTQQNSSWDPLFGLTGIHTEQISLSFPAIVAIIFAIGIGLLGLGIKFHSYASYIGLSILTIGIIMILGIAVAFAFVVIYVLGFVGVATAWKINSRRRK